MSYQDGFVVSCIVNGKPVREFNENDSRVARIPFGSEYALRLKNNHSVRAKATVTIDGTEVLMHGKALILQPYQSIDLERFVENLKAGRKFKFVEATSGGVQDPTSPQNGLITVTFQKEYVPPMQVNLNANFNSTPGCFGGILRSSSFETTYDSHVVESSCSVNSASDLGATIEGSVSNQSFVQGADFMTEFSSTVIQIRLKGPSVDKPAALVRIKLGSTPDVWIRGEYVSGTKAVTVVAGKASIAFWNGTSFETDDFVLV